MNNLPINTGTFPDPDAQVNDSSLVGGFVTVDGEVKLLPTIVQEYELENTRAAYSSSLNDRQILVTYNQVYYIENGVQNFVGAITYSTAPVRIAENRQNQVGIANGAGAWVWDQNSGALTELTEAGNGFDLTNPVDVTILNNLMIFVDGRDRKWVPSEANNALVYNGNDVQTTDNSMGTLTGIAVLNNNLFIFGTGGVQRWVPTVERTTTDFPFSYDPTYRDEYGCFATGSLISEKNNIFYLSENGQIRHMSLSGKQTITNDGISEEIKNYGLSNDIYGSFYYHKGHYLYQISFVDNDNAFIYCLESKKWSESPILLIGYDDFAVLSDGLYTLSSDYTNAFYEVIIKTPFIYADPKNIDKRMALTRVILDCTQGKGSQEQICDLQLSKDNIVFGNRVRRQFSSIAKRLYQFRWFASFSNNTFCFRFTLQVKQDITIKSAVVQFS